MPEHCHSEQIFSLLSTCNPANIYMFKINNINTRERYKFKVTNKNTRMTSLTSILLLTLNISDFEQVNFNWEYSY